MQNWQRIIPLAQVCHTQAETDKWGGHSASQMFHDNLLFEDLSSNIHSHANYDQWIGNIFYDGKFSQKWKMTLNADYVSRKLQIAVLIKSLEA